MTFHLYEVEHRLGSADHQYRLLPMDTIREIFKYYLSPAYLFMMRGGGAIKCMNHCRRGVSTEEPCSDCNRVIKNTQSHLWLIYKLFHDHPFEYTYMGGRRWKDSLNNRHYVITTCHQLTVKLGRVCKVSLIYCVIDSDNIMRTTVHMDSPICCTSAYSPYTNMAAAAVLYSDEKNWRQKIATILQLSDPLVENQDTSAAVGNQRYVSRYCAVRHPCYMSNGTALDRLFGAPIMPYVDAAEFFKYCEIWSYLVNAGFTGEVHVSV